jgi:L-iditol 2-dehydrogenase
VGAGKIAFDPLITNHFSFDEYKKAYDLIDQQKDKAMKVIIVMDPED